MVTETVIVDVASCELVSGLGRILGRHGYRAICNFEVRLEDGTPGVVSAGDNGCVDLTVLQIFRESSVLGWANALAGVIFVRGREGQSTISLTTPDAEGDLAARFASMMVDVITQ